VSAKVLTPTERDRIAARERMRRLRKGHESEADWVRHEAARRLIEAHRREFDRIMDQLWAEVRPS